LDTVVDALEQAGTELDREGLSGAVDGVADADAGWGVLEGTTRRKRAAPHTSLLVHLDRRLVGIDANHLADELLVANFDLLE
jgi:hypothetical protein